MLTISSHIVLGLTGALYFTAVSPFPREGGPEFGEEFAYIKKFWLAFIMVSILVAQIAISVNYVTEPAWYSRAC